MREKSDETGNVLLNGFFNDTTAPEIYWRRDVVNINFRHDASEIYERNNVQNY